MADDDDKRLRSNLARLRGSLDKARATRGAEAPPHADAPGPARGDSGLSLGLRAGSEFVSAVIVGAGVGWALDRGLGTNPAFLIVFFMIGVAAGVWNVIRVTSPKGGGSGGDSRLSDAEAPDKGMRPGPGEARDASRGRGASGGAMGAADGADDDED